MTLTVASTFTGIGGFNIAATRAGMEISWMSEINPDARSVLETRFPSTTLYGDIAEIGRSHAFPRTDILCGGFPCQDLSVAGKRAGLAGDRSGLFYEFARIAEESEPEWIVLENVPGLLSSNGGRDMGAVIGTLADLGYGWAYRVLDAQNFGVAQRRKRVFIVGHLGGGTGAGQVLFEPEGSVGDIAPSREKGTSVSANLTAGVATGSGVNPPGRRQVVSALTANGVGTCGADDNQGQAGHLISDTLRSHPRPGSNSNGSIVAANQTQGYATVREGLSVRRLTPRECERLQGFPDDWTATPNPRSKPMPDGSRYRMLGNAVAVPCVEWVFRRLALVAENLG